MASSMTSVATSRSTAPPSRDPDRESAPLRIGQSQPAPSQLCLQRPILSAKEGDHIPLLALQPSEQRREEDLEGNHGLSLRRCLRPSFRTLRLTPEEREQLVLVLGLDETEVQSIERKAQAALVRTHLPVKTATLVTKSTTSARSLKAEAMATAVVDVLKRALTVRDERIALLETRLRTVEEMIAKQEVPS